MIFRDRTHAGQELAHQLKEYAGRENVLLFALPRGGVVVGAEIAKGLRLPLDVIVTRKIGAPLNEEYAIGALAETGEIIWNEAERAAAHPDAIAKIVEDEKQEAVRRIETYRQGRALPDFSGKTVILIDDGVATGLTIRAAVAAARHNHAKEIIIAVPHGAKDSIAVLRRDVNRVTCLFEPEWYGAVGQFYETFPQTNDEEVMARLKQYGRREE